MRWLIDGFNVALSDQKLSRLMKIDSEQARHELAMEILGSKRLSKEDINLVFDGRFAPSSSREGPRLVVRFTSRGETADEWIKREIGNSTRRRSLTVVSNDLSILGYAKECGAATMKSGDFLSMVRAVNERGNGMVIDDEKPESAGKFDEELLDLFKGKRK